MTSGPDFLLAARQCEITELEQLAQTAELVGVIGRLIHALQRERGMSNIHLSSRGLRFSDQRLQQVAECEAVEQVVRARFEQLRADAGRLRNGSRLFSRIALVLHGLEALPQLRRRIADQDLAAAEATVGYTKLVTGLLAVVFEAADTAGDPEVSRSLVALFNYMQGKEFAGQERALGSRLFGAGAIDPDERQQWLHLVDLQQSCLQAFADFSDPQVLRPHQASQDPLVLAEIERLRRIGCSGRACTLDSAALQAWYEACTRRIDAMRQVEELLALHLRKLCEDRIAQAREELRDQRALLDSLGKQALPAGADGRARYGPQLERSIVEMVQEQSRRLQAMSDELDAVRASLNERKVVERAKGLLMAHRQMSEGEAYKALRQMAMNQNKRLIDVADAVLSLADVLPGGRP